MGKVVEIRHYLSHYTQNLPALDQKCPGFPLPVWSLERNGSPCK